LLNVLSVPLAVVAFLMVWMVSHVINVLIIISPFTTVDAALKSGRLLLLGTVAGTSLINPYAGAIWSVLIIVVCFFLAGWAFRLMVFGSVFAWDIFTLRRRRFRVNPAENWVFTAREIANTPVRTCGRLVREPQAGLMLSYRPWLLLPRRTLRLPPGNYAVGRGLFYSEVILVEGDSAIPVLTLPPRYRCHEEEFRAIYALSSVRDAGIVKGLKAVWIWLKGAFEGRTGPVVPTSI
jgi:hypothetical protein